MLRIIATTTIALTLMTFAQSSTDWQHPFSDPENGWSDVYLAPASKYGPGHRGVDLAQPVGSAIKAPLSGEIAFAGIVVDREVVTIRSNAGYLASFEPACTNHRVGQPVLIGAEFAWHCLPQESYEYHCESCVHFSVRSQYGYLSPDYFLEEMMPSVLLG